jgi:hypothetical protein
MERKRYEGTKVPLLTSLDSPKQTQASVDTFQARITETACFLQTLANRVLIIQIGNTTLIKSSSSVFFSGKHYIFTRENVGIFL